MLEFKGRRGKRLRIVFMGTPDFAVLPLEYLALNQYQVVAVYTQPDKPAGRGHPLTFSPVKRVALELGLQVVQPTSLKGAEVASELASLKPDVIVVAAFGQILPRSVLDIPQYGCLNLHPSLLPRFRGASPVQAAILAGDNFSGVSIMLMDEGLDTGPVLSRAKVPISSRDTTGSLTAKLSRLAAMLLQEILTGGVRGELKPRPQDESQVTYSDLISPEQSEINWQLPAVDIWRQVRAFQPWPGCFTRWQGRKLKVIEAEPLPLEKLKFGQVTSLPEDVFGVGTGAGVLKVLTVQLEGKRVLPAAEFLRGQRHFIGEVLPS